MFIYLFFLINLSFSLYLKDNLHTSDSYRILDRFCFKNKNNYESRIEYIFFLNRVETDIDINSKYNYILLYSTDLNIDNYIDNNNLCRDKISRANYVFDIKFDQYYYYYPIIFNNDNFKCYYVVILSCNINSSNQTNSIDSLSINYKMYLYNGRDSWNEQISGDEENILILSLVF